MPIRPSTRPRPRARPLPMTRATAAPPSPVRTWAPPTSLSPSPTTPSSWAPSRWRSVPPMLNPPRWATPTRP